jgi:amino acid adenylation domain-containing protein
LVKIHCTLPAERQAIQNKGVDPRVTSVEVSKEEIEQSIPARFEKTVRIYPERTAVVGRDRTLSYKKLNEAANRVAWAIAEITGTENEPVAILLEQGAMAVVAILGVLKAGGIYVPLESAFPHPRLKYLLGDATAGVIITNSQNLLLAKKASPVAAKVLNIDDLHSGDVSSGNLELSLTPATLASIIYTSGSTGQPKGVIQNHRNLLHLVARSTNFYHLSPDNRIALLRSFSVSGGTLHTFGALLNGAALLPFDLKQESVANLAKWLIEAEVTNCSFSPRIFRQLIEILRGDERFPKLRHITLSGEPLYSREIQSCRKYFSPDCVFVNSLGATEIPFAAQYVVDNQAITELGLVPVGFPAKGMKIRLVQENGGDVRAGEIGEIVVQSRYLALGYWRSPELTRQKFVQDLNGGNERSYLTGDVGRYLPDGSLLHLGRKDDLVKIRGYRVSILEIEMTLLEYPHLREAAVAIWENEMQDPFLAAYVVAKSERTPSPNELLDFLRERFPDYMIPSSFMFLERLPQTNGKVDRHALPRPEQVRPNLDQAYAAATEPIERQLVAIWEEILIVHPIGIHDNFFDLGGHSLAASRVISRVIETFGLELPLKALFASPTVAEMAKIIALNETKKAGQEALARLVSEVEALSEEETQQRLVEGDKGDWKKY